MIPSSFKKLTAAGLYASTSVCILISNKLILTTFNFRFPFLMTFAHMLTTLILLQAVSTAGLITQIKFDWKIAKKVKRKEKASNTECKRKTNRMKNSMAVVYIVSFCRVGFFLFVLLQMLYWECMVYEEQIFQCLQLFVD